MHRTSSVLRSIVRWQAAVVMRSERGASLVEYALLGIFIAVVAAIAVQILGQNTGATLEDYTSRVVDARS